MYYSFIRAVVKNHYADQKYKAWITGQPFVHIRFDVTLYCCTLVEFDFAVFV